MITCRSIVKVLPNGEVQLCEAPAFKYRDGVPICLQHELAAKAQEKSGKSETEEGSRSK